MGFAEKLAAKSPKPASPRSPSLELPPHIIPADAQLPSNYEQAKKALLHCASIDECRDWDDKSAAHAAYAHIAQDEALRRLAERVQAHALRRCGELLRRMEQFGRPPEGDSGAVRDAEATDEQSAPQAAIPARLPATYEQAKAALQKCLSIDECRSWASREEALGAYARMAQDDSLLKLAERIRVRAGRQIADIQKLSGEADCPTGKASGKRSSFQAIAAGDAGTTKRKPRAAAPVAVEPQSVAETPARSVEESVADGPADVAERPAKGKPAALAGASEKPVGGQRSPVEAASAVGPSQLADTARTADETVKEPDQPMQPVQETADLPRNPVAAAAEAAPTSEAPVEIAAEPNKIADEPVQVAEDAPNTAPQPVKVSKRPAQAVDEPLKIAKERPEEPVQVAGERESFVRSFARIVEQSSEVVKAPARLIEAVRPPSKPVNALGRAKATKHDLPPATTEPTRAGLSRPPRSEGSGQKHYLPGTVKQFAEFCRAYSPEGVAGDVKARDVAAVKQQVATIEAWLGRFVVRLRE